MPRISLRLVSRFVVLIATIAYLHNDKESLALALAAFAIFSLVEMTDELVNLQRILAGIYKTWEQKHDQ